MTDAQHSHQLTIHDGAGALAVRDSHCHVFGTGPPRPPSANSCSS
ncbi:MAG: hypothetical protein OEY62_02710 [Acidimicrobiia bacterium]|nr:hypothetical protein [Acidimicrobiia bacterium]